MEIVAIVALCHILCYICYMVTKYEKTGRLPPSKWKSSKERVVPHDIRALKEEICERLLSEPLVAICHDEWMPSVATIRSWIAADPKFAKDCEDARQLFGEHQAYLLNKLNNEVWSGQLDPKAAAVLSNNLKWQAEKHNPKHFGAKSEVSYNAAVSGEIVTRIEMVHVGADGRTIEHEPPPAAMVDVTPKQRLEPRATYEKKYNVPRGASRGRGRPPKQAAVEEPPPPVEVPAEPLPARLQKLTDEEYAKIVEERKRAAKLNKQPI